MKKLLLSSILCFMIVFSVFSLSACADIIETHNILTTYYNAQYGTTSGSGNYTTNSTVVIKAMPQSGHSFIAWVKNDSIISRDAEYSFIASNQTEGKYTALFTTDTLEFFKISEISYEITGLDLTATELQLNNITSIDIKSGTTSGLYNNLASAPSEEMSNTGNFSTLNFQFDERIFYKSKLYYFFAKLNYDYFNIQSGATSTGEINSNFNIDFTLLNNGTVNGNVITYTSTNYTLTQTFENDVYTVEIDYTNLQKPTGWNQEATHKLNFKFVYPFESETE